MSEKDLYIGGTLIKESASFVACVYVFHQHIIGRCRQNLCFHQPILGLQSILQTKNRLDDLRPAVRSRFNRSLGDT